MFRVIIISCLSICCAISMVTAQDIKNYQKQRQILNEHINMLDQSLDSKQREKYSLTKNYQLLEKKIEKREELQTTIQNEMRLIDSLVQVGSTDLSRLEDMSQVREEQYAYYLRKAYYHQLQNNTWLTWLSSSSIRDYLLKRRYHRQITDHVDASIRELDRLTQSIQDTISYLSDIRQEKLKLLSIEEKNLYALSAEKKSSQSLIEDIFKEESRLRAELQKQRQEGERLNKIITELIKKEEEAAKAELAVDNVSLTGGFVNNKNSLPWPVKGGVITDRFGIKQHPTLRNVRTQNLGIDMLCDAGAKITSIYDGTVLIVTQQHPYENIVIVNHGDFTTAYFYLVKPYVKKGDSVKAGEVLGELGRSTSNADFHFEIWRDQQQVDPELWLRHR